MSSKIEIEYSSNQIIESCNSKLTSFPKYFQNGGPLENTTCNIVNRYVTSRDATDRWSVVGRYRTVTENINFVFTLPTLRGQGVYSAYSPLVSSGNT